MNGEHVGTTSRMIITSGKSVIWTLAALGNQGFGKMRKFPRGKRPRHLLLLDIKHMGGGRRLSSRLEKEFSYCCYEHYLLSVS
jgi:hypothetical protein